MPVTCPRLRGWRAHWPICFQLWGSMQGKAEQEGKSGSPAPSFPGGSGCRSTWLGGSTLGQGHQDLGSATVCPEGPRPQLSPSTPGKAGGGGRTSGLLRGGSGTGPRAAEAATAWEDSPLRWGSYAWTGTGFQGCQGIAHLRPSESEQTPQGDWGSRAEPAKAAPTALPSTTQQHLDSRAPGTPTLFLNSILGHRRK